MIDKLLNPKDDVKFHAVCPHCSAYVGEFGKMESNEICEVCRSQLDVANPSDISFFVLINPTRQISDLLHTFGDHYDYIMNSRFHKRNHIEDVYDGKMYRKFVDTLSEEDKHNYVTAVLNTDGAPKFKSSKMSIWPLYIKINELPPQERMNNLITMALWFNKKKPDMTVYLDKIVDEINLVTREKIPCYINGMKQLVQLNIINCCVDSQARAPMQGIKQSNGSFGCNWCLHPGIYAEGSMRYPILNPAPKCRVHETTVKLMEDATLENPLSGIKRPSALINLPKFDIIESFVPDYLHCCLEGVALQITTYLEKFMKKTDIENIDKIMKKIAAPNQVTRLCRPFSGRNDYKAREWENLILYCSVPIFMNRIPTENFDHWLLFVEALYILLQKSINIDDLNRADILLCSFVGRTEALYGLKAMTFNVHQMLHLSKSVLNWGPLWTNSTFGFESANYDVLRAIKCSKGVTQQIVRYIKLNQSFSVLQESLGHNVSHEVLMYCNDIQSNKINKATRTSGIDYFGRNLNIGQNLLQNLHLSESRTFHNKMIKDRFLYESADKLKSRSNNSYAILTDGRFIRIGYFVLDIERNIEVTLCQFIHTRNVFEQEYKIVEKIDHDQSIVSTKDIDNICICMSIGEKMYLCALPNLLHY